MWTENTGRLVDLGETALHPIVLLTHLIGSQVAVEIERVTTGVYEPRRQELRSMGFTLSPTAVTVEGRAEGTKVRIEVSKYCEPADHRRSMFATYDSARLTADFDARTLLIADLSGRPLLALRVPVTIRNYGVLMTLFRRQLIRAPHTGRVDDLDNQLRALELWAEICERAVDSKPVSYGGDPSSSC